jgi:hypothetical protein
MTNDRADVGCHYLGEYVEEAECPPNVTPRQGEVVRPHVVGEFIELWASDETMREFTVLLKDGSVIAVRGHALKYAPHSIAGQDVYSIVGRVSGEEVLVALFKSADVVGIFHGDMRSGRKIA